MIPSHVVRNERVTAVCARRCEVDSPADGCRLGWGTLAASSLVLGAFQGGINGFAADALLVMLVDTMIPDAAGKTGRVDGVVTALGFAVAAGLSGLST